MSPVLSRGLHKNPICTTGLLNPFCCTFDPSNGICNGFYGECSTFIGIRFATFSRRDAACATLVTIMYMLLCTEQLSGWRRLAEAAEAVSPDYLGQVYHPRHEPRAMIAK